MPTPPQVHTRLGALLLLLAVILGLAVLWAQHPGDLHWLPPCPTLALTGLYCPGCGSLRAVHHLLHGRVALAWHHNPALLLLGLPALLLCALQFGRRAVGGRDALVIFTAAPWFGWTVLALLLLFTAARNLPAAAFDWLRPPDATGKE